MPIIIEKHIEEAQSRNKWLWASFVESTIIAVLFSRDMIGWIRRVDSAFQSPFFGTPFMR